MSFVRAPSFRAAGFSEAGSTQSRSGVPLLRSGSNLGSSSSKALSGQALPSLKAAAPAASGARLRRRMGAQAVSSTTEVSPAGTGSSLPVKEVPGSYGVPWFGKLKDRLDYFWFQGSQTFFQSRIEKYGTVFRTHMPPGWPDGRVVMLCDQKSFPVLYDMDKVDKTDVFTGTYMPSVSFTGGYRVLPYLDPSEERHTKLKGFCFDVLKSNGQRFLPEFNKAINEAYAVWEGQLAKDGKSDFKAECSQFSFDFLMRSVAHRDPVAPGENSLGASGASNLTAWIALQLVPIASSGVLPKWLDELVLHNFPLPSFLAQSGYDKVYKFLETYATDMVEIATKQHGLEKEDALHNLFFYLNFNTHGGINILFPSIIQYVGDAGAVLQKELADEVRSVVKANGGTVTRKAIEEMKLVGSVVYEVLRIVPPVPFQYGRAKKDFVLESWDGAFQIKKGELLGGSQPNATQDPRVFSDPTIFKPKRFLGEEGEKLLQYVLWSNGPETSSPTLANKQCAGKDFVVFITRVFVAEFFLRYDSFEIQPGPVFTKLNVAASSS